MLRILAKVKVPEIRKGRQGKGGEISSCGDADANYATLAERRRVAASLHDGRR